jgi:hypothetical protein
MPENPVSELSVPAVAELAAYAVASRGGVRQACVNCATPLIGPFCAACGQPHDTNRKSFSHLVRQSFEHIVSFDSKFVRTVYALMLKPGELSLAFKAGQTQRYVLAPRLYVFVSLLFFLILSISGIALLQLEIDVSPAPNAAAHAAAANPQKNAAPIFLRIDRKDLVAMEGKARPHRGAETAIDRLRNAPPDVTARAHFFERYGTVRSSIPYAAKAQLVLLSADAEKNAAGPLGRWFATHVVKAFGDTAQDPAALNGPLSAWIPRALFLLLPLFALLLWLFYWRQRREFYLVDHLVFSLTLHSFAFVVLIVAALAVQFAPAYAVAHAALLVVGVYFFVALRRFYGQSYVWTAAKFVSVSFVYICCILAPALGAAVIASMIQA